MRTPKLVPREASLPPPRLTPNFPLPITLSLKNPIPRAARLAQAVAANLGSGTPLPSPPLSSLAPLQAQPLRPARVTLCEAQLSKP